MKRLYPILSFLIFTLLLNCSASDQPFGSKQKTDTATQLYPSLFFSTIGHSGNSNSNNPYFNFTGQNVSALALTTQTYAPNCGDFFYFATESNLTAARAYAPELTPGAPTPPINIFSLFSCLFRVTVPQTGHYDIRMTITSSANSEILFNASHLLAPPNTTPTDIFGFYSSTATSAFAKLNPTTYQITHFNYEFQAGNFYELITLLNGMGSNTGSELCGFGTLTCTFVLELIPIPPSNCGTVEHAPVHSLYAQNVTGGDVVHISGRNPEDVCYFKLTDAVNTPYSINITPDVAETMRFGVSPVNEPDPLKTWVVSHMEGLSGETLTRPGILMYPGEFRYFNVGFTLFNGTSNCTAGNCGFTLSTTPFTDSCADIIMTDEIERALRYNAPTIALNTPVTVDRLTRKATCIEKLNIDTSGQYELWMTMPSGYNFQIYTGSENVIVDPAILGGGYEHTNVIGPYIGTPTQYYARDYLYQYTFTAGSFRYIRSTNYTVTPGSNWKDCLTPTECTYTYTYIPVNDKYVFETRRNATTIETADTSLALYGADGVTPVLVCVNADTSTDPRYAKITCPKFLLPSGTYYLKVGIENNDNGPYSLSMRAMDLEPTACPQSSKKGGNPTRPDKFEDGDDVVAGASTLTAGCANALDRTIDVGDVDWFKFVIP